MILPDTALVLPLRLFDPASASEGLRNRKVLVKNVSKIQPLLANCPRLTVGAAHDNAQRLAALEKVL